MGTGLGVGGQGLVEAALLKPHRAELALADSYAPRIAQPLGAADGLLIGRRLVEPAQIEQTVATLAETDRGHALGAATGLGPRHGLEAVLGLVHQSQCLVRVAGRLQHFGEQIVGHGQVIVGDRIGPVASGTGPLQQRAGAVEGGLELATGELLLDAGALGLKGGIGPLPAEGLLGGAPGAGDALLQTRAAEKLEEPVQRGH